MNPLEQALHKKKDDDKGDKKKHTHKKGKDGKCMYCNKSMAQDEFVKEDGDDAR